MKDLIIFGLGSFAEVAYEYFTKDSDYTVRAFTVDSKYIDSTEKFGLPVIPFEEIERHFPPSESDMFIAVGFRKMNALRARKFQEAREKGYRIAKFVSPHAFVWKNVEIGEGSFVFENNVIQPFAVVGEDTIIWSGNHIGHHSKIGSHCFITSHVVISGNVEVGDFCFLGVNSSIVDGVKIAERNLIGAGALITKNTKPGEVYAVNGTKPLKVKSDRFFR